MSQNHSVILYAKRTAIGKMNGALQSVPAPRLGAAVIADAVKTTGIPGDRFDEVIMGQVLTAGVGQAPARQASIYGGLPHSVRATTINRVCGSGLKAVMLADQAIRLGEAEVIFAGGQENMSLAPHLLPGARMGYRFGSFEAKDSMQWDGLWDPYNDKPMGHCGDVCASEYKFDREMQDRFSRTSYERSRQASESGHFAREIVAVEVQQRRDAVSVTVDEEPFSVDLDKLPKLRAAFNKDGTVTAGNASSINDGAAGVVVCSESAAKGMDQKPIARIVAQASHAQDPLWFTTAPVGAIKKVLDKAGLKTSDIGCYEVNEAFAVVAMAAIKDLDLDPEKVNPYGGAVSLGHPIGCSGARVLVTLLNAMEVRQQRYGLATLCIGGGEASAVVVERL